MASHDKPTFQDAQTGEPKGEIVLNQGEDGLTRVECRFLDEALWRSQAPIAERFQKDVWAINEHLQNIYEEGVLTPEATIRKFRIVRPEGARLVGRNLERYGPSPLMREQAA